MTESPASEETSLVITDMGPKVIYYLEKARNWQAAVTYNLIGRANYTAPGAEATELRGTSYKFEIGYLGQMWDKVFMGAKINYYSASFAEEISGETSIEKVTHGRAVIYPSFAMTIRWE
ncbi:MAG TPA: hypothetical protein PKC28_03860 [Bdellovibrionales bacterium]|nr:hypothetical protein [Bdellovibrionales bacterium]